MVKDKDKEEAGCVQLAEGDLVTSTRGNQYKVLLKLGEGGFGAVYKVVMVKEPDKLFGMKVESVLEKMQVLKMEVSVLKALTKASGRHFCKIMDRGRNERFNYIIMTLVGSNLSDVRKERPGYKFSLGTSMCVGIQCLEAIEDLHEIDFLHRDIKPGNYAMGREAVNENRKVYILDFGMCRPYRNEKGELRTPRSAANFRGTVRYAPLNCHHCRELARKDDLEMWFYMLVEITRGSLPWRHSAVKQEVGRFKEHARTIDGKKELLKDCPRPFERIMDYIDGLPYWERPDYDFIYHHLRRILTKNGLKEEDAYDWELKEESHKSEGAN